MSQGWLLLLLKRRLNSDGVCGEGGDGAMETWQVVGWSYGRWWDSEMRGEGGMNSELVISKEASVCSTLQL